MIDTPRPAGDIASRSLRITLGGREYVLAVLFIAGNERWRQFSDAHTEAFIEESVALGNDRAAVIAKFDQEPDLYLDLIYAYDTDCDRRAGVLPPRDELKETIYEDEPEVALREVVRAANPKAVVGLERIAMAGLTMNGSSPPTSTSPTPTAGRSKRSGRR